MKYFNKIILASALVGSFTFSFAQKVDAKAKTILETVSKNYKAKKILTSNFLTEREREK